MKKLKFLFALIIFISCSNDNNFETTILPQNDVKEQKSELEFTKRYDL